MSERPRRSTCAFVLLAVLGAPAPVRPAAPDLSQLHDTWKQLRMQVLEAEAERDQLLAEMEVVQNGAASGSVPAAAGPNLDRLVEPIRDELRHTQESRKKVLDNLAAAVEANGKVVRADWEKAADERLDLRDRIAAAEAAGEAGDVPLWDARFRRLTACGGLVLLVGVLLAYHALRVQVRREWRCGRRLSALAAVCRRSWLSALAVGAMLVALGGSAVVAPAPAAPGELRGPARLEKERADLEKACGDLRADLEKLQKRIRDDREQVKAGRQVVLDRWSQWLSLGGNAGGLPAAVVASEEAAYETLHRVQCRTALAQTLAADGDSALEQVAADAAGLDSRLAENRSQSRLAASLRLGACLAFVLLAFAPLAAARRRLRRELAAAARQCPRCLSNGQLKEKEVLHDPRYPDPGYVHCPECSYEFRSAYLRYPRLCFPTVGIRSGGKTHWLVTAYDRIKTTNVPVRATLKQVPSPSDERFDKIMQEVLEKRRRPGFTPPDLPVPLNFNLADRDRLGAGTALFNLFDFSGEVMSQHINQDLLRRRALLMDGFVLFLDPTQVRGGGTDASIRDQVNQLGEFYEQMCAVRGLEVGQKIPMPVAVCISKLDLLMTRNPMAGRALPWIRDLRKTAGRVDLAAIRTRSRLCEEQLHLMFPGWPIARSLRENFGNRFLFFPMTPVGLEESELGPEVVDDLEKRSIQPFGILEPILWLLHAHGYSVFD